MLETWLPDTTERFVYTKFSDCVPIINGIYVTMAERKGDWSGHVITTLSAGWPLVFSEWGASFCTAIDRNEAQYNYVTRKFSEPGMEHFADFLENKSSIHVIDIMNLNDSFWNDKVNGDEFVFLSNICDHAETEGRIDDFLHQIAQLVKASSNLTELNVVFTSFGSRKFSSYLDKLNSMVEGSHIKAELEIIEGEEKFNSRLLTNAGVFTFKPQAQQAE